MKKMVWFALLAALVALGFGAANSALAAPVVAPCASLPKDGWVSGNRGVEYRQVWFMSGDLRIGGFIAKPQGPGPFPGHIHNHGSLPLSVASRPLWSSPPPGIGLSLAQAGFVVLWPARRGNLGSEGSTDSYARVDDPAAPPLHRVISSAFEEAKDVVAAFDFLQGCLFVDGQRIALGGHSMGGVVAVIAAAEIPVKALLLINAGYRRVERGGPDQGPGAVSEVWEKAVPRVSAPTLVLQAKSDGVVSSDSGQRLAKMLQARGVPVELKPYDGGHTTVPPLEIVMGFLKKHLLSGSAARAR